MTDNEARAKIITLAEKMVCEHRDSAAGILYALAATVIAGDDEVDQMLVHIMPYMEKFNDRISREIEENRSEM